MNSQRSILFAVILTSVLLFPRGLPAQLTTVRIAFNGFGGTAPIFLGTDAGIFKKQGLNLEMVFIPGGSLSLQALIGRSLDLLLTGGPPVVNAYLQGAKIKIIGGVTNLLPYTFIVPSTIRSAEQIKDKKIGISRFGSNTDYVERPNQRASGVLDNTPAGLLNTQSALPGPWTLPSKNNPWLQY